MELIEVNIMTEQLCLIATDFAGIFNNVATECMESKLPFENFNGEFTLCNLYLHM